jgi:hypothetical protein
MTRNMDSGLGPVARRSHVPALRPRAIRARRCRGAGARGASRRASSRRGRAGPGSRSTAPGCSTTPGPPPCPPPAAAGAGPGGGGRAQSRGRRAPARAGRDGFMSHIRVTVTRDLAAEHLPPSVLKLRSADPDMTPAFRTRHNETQPPLAPISRVSVAEHVPPAAVCGARRRVSRGAAGLAGADRRGLGGASVYRSLTAESMRSR